MAWSPRRRARRTAGTEKRVSDTTRTRLRSYIVDNILFGDDRGFEDGTSFLEAGIIDSTGVLELVDYIERAFEVEVADAELMPENFDSLDKLTAFVERKLA